MNVKFSKELIKGKIAETIFEQMIREEGRYEVLPFGYEHTMPSLAQYREKFSEISKVIENISDAPDFALVSNDKKNLYLVEVKYRRMLVSQDLMKTAEKLLKHWEYPWLFVATPHGFYCGQCKDILAERNIRRLSSNWVQMPRQTEYTKLLNEFIYPNRINMTQT